MIGKRVLVRFRNAGVHFGTLTQFGPDFLTLENAKRLWSWVGAFTLSEISQFGVRSARIATEVPIMTFSTLDHCEIIPLTDEAAKSLDAQGAD